MQASASRIVSFLGKLVIVSIVFEVTGAFGILQHKEKYFPTLYVKHKPLLKTSYHTVKPVYCVRGQFAAFLTFKAKNQRPIIILLFETLQFRFL